MFGISPVSLDIMRSIYKTVKILRKDFRMKSELVRFQCMELSPEIGTTLFLEMKDRPNFMEDPNNPKKDLNLYIEIIKSIMGTSNLSIYLLLAEFIIRYNAFIPKSQLPYYKMKMKTLQKDVWVITQYVNAYMILSLMTQMIYVLQNKLGDNAVLLYPAFPSTAFQHYQVLTKSSGITYSMIFNILGCPSTLVPVGFDKKGLPIGIQVGIRLV